VCVCVCVYVCKKEREKERERVCVRSNVHREYTWEEKRRQQNKQTNKHCGSGANKQMYNATTPTHVAIRHDGISPREEGGWRNLEESQLPPPNTSTPKHTPGGYGTKSLLAGGVPNLQFDHFSVHFDGAELEVHTQCADETL
jgi:hypothetical protein